MVPCQSTEVASELDYDWQREWVIKVHGRERRVWVRYTAYSERH